MRLTLPSTCWLLAGLLCVPAVASAQDRRSRSTPGIVLDVKARMGNCDVLAFDSDGKELFAVGDDKVVRTWKVGPDSIDADSSRAFRWPIYREQTGAIYAMAISPDGKRIAIGGHGLRIGLIAVLDRETGQIVRVMRRREPLSHAVTTFLAWSPDGKYILQGTGGRGELFCWEPDVKDSEGVGFQTDLKDDKNWVRLISFLPDGKHFLVVTERGGVFLRTLDVKSPAQSLLSFPDRIRYAAISPDKSRLALARMDTSPSKVEDRDVDLIDVKAMVAGGGKRSLLPGVKLPSRHGFHLGPTTLAFSPDSSQLAIGMQEVRVNSSKGFQEFGRTTGGVVHVWSLTGAKPEQVTKNGFQTGYDVDGLTFRPKHPGQIATAGGPNHEVRLFDLANEAAPLKEVRSPGSCIWSIRMSDDGKYLAWREQLNTDPQHPNDRASGPWRFFTLAAPADGRPRRILQRPPENYKLVEPLATLDGWKVVTLGGFLWSVVHEPTGFRVKLDRTKHLYHDGVNQVPQCYTFVKSKGRLPRLAVGHMWGVSLYELDASQPDDDKKVKLVRGMLGHQGSVMSVAPSKDGDLLVSAGRDQTICCWSLREWPSKTELGARFVEQNGEVHVSDVDPGSPAWEIGLTVGERIDFVGICEPDSIRADVYDPYGNLNRRKGTLSLGRHVFEGEEDDWNFIVRKAIRNPQDIIKQLHEAKTARNHMFGRLDKPIDQGGKMHGQFTSLRQRPLWVLFPTRAEKGNHWLVWRWRDYVYDSTMQQTDQLAGLQRTASDTETPRFYQLGQVAGTIGKRSNDLEQQYYNPPKVWKYIEDVFAKDTDTAKILFADVEPPKVELTVTRDKEGSGYVAHVTVTPRQTEGGDLPDRQAIRRVSLWLNDYLFDAGAPIPTAEGKKPFSKPYKIPSEILRTKTPNQVRAVGFNAAGGFDEATQTFEFKDPSRGRQNLLALCVGISDYSKVGAKGLPCAKNDAMTLHEVFLQHKGSELFDQVIAKGPLIDGQATREAILGRLDELARRARPDDWMVLYLSGHGAGERLSADEDDARIQPGSFFFVCADSKIGKPQTGLRAQDLNRALGKINCNKLILMDACHAGDNITDPIRELTRNEAKFLIFTACRNYEFAIEPDDKEIQEAIKNNREKYGYLEGLTLKHGLFTLGLLNTLGHPDATRGRPRVNRVSAFDVRRKIDATVSDMLINLNQSGKQTPQFFPDNDQALRRLFIFCAPPPGRKP